MLSDAWGYNNTACVRHSELKILRRRINVVMHTWSLLKLYAKSRQVGMREEKREVDGRNKGGSEFVYDTKDYPSNLGKIHFAKCEI